MIIFIGQVTTMALFYNISSMNHKTQKEDFTLERPNGYSKYTFLHFISPVRMYVDNTNIKTSTNTVIIIPPNEFHSYAAANQLLVHDYVHFDVVNTHYFESLAFPLNLLFNTDIGETISTMVEEITWLFSPDTIDSIPDHLDKSDNLLNQLFIEISIAYKRINTTNVKELNIHKNFDIIRNKVYDNPQLWDVQKMANSASFSRTRFSVLYTNIYHVTPQEDVIQASLNLAKNLLATSHLTLNQIAFQCGYESASYLARLFKSRENMTPGKYRKIIASKNKS